jgi:hypothetical protein
MSEGETGTEDEGPEDAPAPPTDIEEIPEDPPDDWLEQKPFDPAGR